MSIGSALVKLMQVLQLAETRVRTVFHLQGRSVAQHRHLLLRLPWRVAEVAQCRQVLVELAKQGVYGGMLLLQLLL